MMKRYFLAIDQGTSSSRAILYNDKLETLKSHQIEVGQSYPQSSWVEQCPEELFQAQFTCIEKILEGLENDAEVYAGITNQRETSIIWDKNTSKPVYPAIVWQDMRTADYCEELTQKGLDKTIKNKTGLVLDAYFSATKISWILDSNPEIRKEAEAGNLLFGTVDTWLMWKLSQGKKHLTDHSNAARTMLFNIHDMNWDKELLEIFNIPASLLPELKTSQAEYLECEINDKKIKIVSVAGDQNASLFGHTCFKKGEAKNTYGTGCFLLVNTGEEIVESKNGLLSTVAFSLKDKKVNYALEGSIFIAGSALNWLKNKMQVLEDIKESSAIAESISEEEMDNLYFVPAFSGLGSPYWDMYARGTIIGLNLDTGKNHLIRATLESLAYQTKDVAGSMENDMQCKLKSLSVDGGGSKNDFMLNFLSGVLGIDVLRQDNVELTAFGIAAMVANFIGLYSLEELVNMNKNSELFNTKFDESKKEKLYNGWKKAVNYSKGWLKN
ncbi:MAG: glycerol kinase GlpK [Candidatus Caenarcaniphilales bacterium]|nr:glycerol kinase GlpK [Candidatus Caenarcaniphilales bacterium]